ncbi:MAG: sugar kinase [Firmicutes bacterium]|nr:sugar kinase [Bacillota bacterium]
MDRLTEKKIVLIKRRTRLDDLVARFNTVQQAKFYIEHLGADFGDYLQEHETYAKALAEAQEILGRLGRVQTVDRSFVPNFIFGPDDLVVVIGQDGLVANTLKYLTNQLLIGVNPDPERWDGVLLPFKVRDLHRIVPEVFKGRRPIKEITMARASLKDGQTLYAVNDFFIGQKTHVSARYRISYGGLSEDQSSSGIIVSTGLGSTGWFTSILTGAAGLVNSVGGRKLRIQSENRFSWDSDYLYFAVREPFPSKRTGTEIVFGKITKTSPLFVLSMMGENGVIFSDGMENDFLAFNSGVEAMITLAEKKGRLVG